MKIIFELYNKKKLHKTDVSVCHTFHSCVCFVFSLSSDVSKGRVREVTPRGRELLRSEHNYKVQLTLSHVPFTLIIQNRSV